MLPGTRPHIEADIDHEVKLSPDEYGHNTELAKELCSLTRELLQGVEDHCDDVYTYAKHLMPANDMLTVAGNRLEGKGLPNNEHPKLQVSAVC